MRRTVIPACLLLAACEEAVAPEQVIPGADPGRGAAIIAEVGCGACHIVPGIRAADGTVGGSELHPIGETRVSGTGDELSVCRRMRRHTLS